jgi:hypothetical protein
VFSQLTATSRAISAALEAESHAQRARELAAATAAASAKYDTIATDADSARIRANLAAAAAQPPQAGRQSTAPKGTASTPTATTINGRQNATTTSGSRRGTLVYAPTTSCRIRAMKRRQILSTFDEPHQLGASRPGRGQRQNQALSRGARTIEAFVHWARKSASPVVLIR